MSGDELYHLERELDRVVDRLTSMPLARAERATGDCRTAAEAILAQTRQLTDEVPRDAELPALAPQGLGAMISVLGHDYLDAARASVEPDVSQVLDALVTLRRALP